MRSSATRSLMGALTCLAGLSFAVHGEAQSDAVEPTGRMGGSIGITSDYVYRGISLSSGNPALQGDIHYRTQGGWVGGIWASRADMTSDEAALEVDLYLGRDWPLGADWDLRTTLTHYTYPDDPRTSSYDYDELAGTLSYRSRLFATVAWSPNITRYSRYGWAHNQSAVSYELTAMQPLIHRIAASAGVGFYDMPHALDADYWFWNVGVACALGRTELTLSYIGTDADAAHAFGYDITADRWAGSVAWRF